MLLRVEVASFHPLRPGFHRGTATRLCGPLRRLAAPGRYPAPCSVEPGLSSGSWNICQRLSSQLRRRFYRISTRAAWLRECRGV